jgi:hypothetical protein
MKSSRLQVSWLSRSVIHSDGRRSITLWRDQVWVSPVSALLAAASSLSTKRKWARK